LKKIRLFSIVCAGVFLRTAFPVPSAAEDIRIVAPHLGAITNKVEFGDYSINLEETVLLKGLYLQWIDTERYQWNLFAYQASDVNYSDVWGTHFIFDYYFGPDWGGKFLAGAGVELIGVDLDAGDHIVATMNGQSAALKNFTMKNTVTIPYLRLGKYFLLGEGPLRFSILTWAGIQPQWVAGDLEFERPSGYNPVTHQFTYAAEDISLDDYEFFGIAGINFKILLARYADVEAKYQASFNSGEYLSTVTVIANAYFSRHWGLSYRFKYMDHSSGSDTYHLVGLAFIF